MLDPRPARLRSQRDINLWRIPLNLSLAAIALFCVTLIPDILNTYAVIHIPPWLTMGGIDDARAILSAMMGAVATVLALIFSVALLVLSMVATLFGPRLLYRFLQDWVTQTTIGLFMGTFIYVCLCFLVTHQDAHSRFVPQISLLTSWLLVVCSFAFLVYYSHRIATSIQNPDMIARIVDDLYPAVVGMHGRAPGEGTGTLPDDGEILRRADSGGIVVCPKSGYMQHLDHGALVAAAREAGALVVLRFRPGHFVLRGEPLASVVPAPLAPRLEAAINRYVNDVVADFAIQTLAALPGKPEVWAVGERVQARLVDAGVSLMGVFAVPNSVQAITPLVGQIQIESEAQRAKGEYARLYVFHNRPKAGALYEPVSQRLLPLDAQWQKGLAGVRWPTGYLPEVMRGGTMRNKTGTLRALIREYLFISLFRACAESLASENASRLAAMERAEKNIKDLLESLQHTFHRVRQSGIDEELFDVISGFEALAGAKREIRP